MILTTTPSVEGKEIMEYKGIVFGEVISGINFIKDFTRLVYLISLVADLQHMKMNFWKPEKKHYRN